MKYKLIKAEYNLDTGVSTVTIGCRLGQFTGTAKLHPEEDVDLRSRYFGCELAESRACVKALKALRREYKNKAAALNEVNSIVKSLKDYNPYTNECRKIRRVYYEYQDKIQNLDTIIKTIEENIVAMPNNREKIIKKILQLCTVTEKKS